MRSLLLLVIVSASCDHPAPPAPPTAPSGSTSTPPPVATPPPLPAPALSGLSITNLGPGEMEIESTTAMKLARVARIERRTEGGWTALDHLDLDRGYRLVTRCESADPPACIDLAPGVPLRPAPFRGFSCSSQCNESCRANAWEGPGTFRFVVTTCEGTSMAGPPFELPGSDHAEALVRWGLAADVVRATALRLDRPHAGWDGASPAAPDKLAGFQVRAGSERPLDAAALGALLERLTSADGFDDRIAKRCVMDNLVGFRVTRRPATTGAAREETLEIAVDFNCQKLFMVRGGDRGRARTVLATHFDPSRTAFLALVKRALPGDAEIAKLR